MPVTGDSFLLVVAGLGFDVVCNGLVGTTDGNEAQLPGLVFFTAMRVGVPYVLIQDQGGCRIVQSARSSIWFGADMDAIRAALLTLCLARIDCSLNSASQLSSGR